MQEYTYNIILGVDADATPVVWQWENASSLAVVGMGGSGKTTSAVYWLSQLACQGVRFLMADPHMDNKQSLYAQTTHMHKSFLAPCVRDYKDITVYANYINDLGHKRMRNEAEHFPLVFVIDEFTSYVINSDESKKACLSMLDSVNQFRKVNLKLVLIGQSWGDAVKKASGLRDAITDAVVLKSKPNNAEKFCAFQATAKEATLLTPGRGYYMDEMLWIPRITETGKFTTQRRVDTYNHTQIALNSKPVTRAQVSTPIYDNEVLLESFLRNSIST